MAKLSRDEIITRLRDIQKLRFGDPYPPWMPDNWGVVLSDLCGQAADEIESLQRNLNFLDAVGMEKE